MKKIVLLGDAANPHIQRWANYLVRRKFDIHIISFQLAEIDGAQIHHIQTPHLLIISPITKLWRKIGYLATIYKVRKLIYFLEPDILHAHWATSYGLAGALSGFHPLIISAWGSDIVASPQTNWIMKRIVQYNLSKADVITATSEMLKKETEKYIQARQTVKRIPFGIDTNIFKPRPKLNKKNIFIGTVKALEEKFGIIYLIKAFAKIKLKIINAQLIIVGYGSQYDYLIKLSESLGVKNSITFTGKIPNDEVVKYLQKMDIFVVPSIYESFGVAAIEASACNLPVVASNIGGLPEVVIDGHTGYFIKPGDVDDLTEKLLILISDEAMRKKMGSEGRKYIECNYTLEKCGLMMEKIYNQFGTVSFDT